MTEIFVCTSFSTKVDPSGNVLPEYRQLIEPVLQALHRANKRYTCAIEAEEWKLTQKDPTEEFKRDLEAIKDCSIMLALLEDLVSSGVQIEIGYMLAQLKASPSKRLLLAHPAGTKLSWSNQAISKLPGVSTQEYKDSEDILKFLET